MNEVNMFNRKLDVVRLEGELKKLEQTECELIHDFSPGVYVRTLCIPKDNFIIGKRHRFATCNILLKGEISIYMGENEPVVRLKAPCIFKSEPGVKKIGYTHEDTMFSNVHPTEETDLDKIEKIFIIPEEEYIENNGGGKCLGEQ